MSDYIVPHLSEEKPDIVIIHCGGNDLPTPSKRPVMLTTIANEIIDTGLLCRKAKVKNIAIAGVTIRETPFLKKRCEELNDLLRSMCKLNNFMFIDNSEITEEHLFDGIHLNQDGSKILAENYLSALWKMHNS